MQSVYLRLSEDIDVPAREPGVLSEIASDEGALVEAGALLARVEDREARLGRDRAALEVEVAKRQADKNIELGIARKSLVVAEAELARAERSRQAVRGAVPQAEVDRLQLELDRATAQILQTERDAATVMVTAKLKEAELALAELRLERHTMLSPLRGRVIEHYKHRGEWVEPGENVLRLVRLDVLRAEGFVDAAALATDPTGAEVSLRVNLPGRSETTFRGRLTFVAPEVEPTTGQVLVRAEIENKDLTLRPGLNAEMTIIPSDGSGVSVGEENATARSPGEPE
ncbi:MAG: HlyD family efflux transporter periplasmic adaptor subunit [Planctomycetota bacterium]|nr:HlyD family efflux transporter periplasmic adaptor subunit [Planctomycetaceae bacterium]MDQ3331611.1 HlyD family efflux transporter periplasmic adaptor subunit [Planctomycetota bacterium]